MLWVGGEPGKTAGPTLRGAARSHTLQEGPNPLAVLKQAFEDLLAQFNKTLEKAKADVTEFTTLLDAG